MNPAQVDLKQTVNLPRTGFPMKANLPLAEPKMLARWEAEDLYGQIRASRAGRETYLLHDGPPYANGKIHLGTAFNKILKDFIVKSKTMAGYDSPYVPGWDCHGLPIEFKVVQELGPKRARMTAAQIRGECRKYAQKWVDRQREDFKRLGIFGRWDDPYLTMTGPYQATIAGAFVDFLDKGYIYKGLKPVHWCIYDRTALAEAEVEYEQHSSPSIWVRFALTSDPAHIDPTLAGRRVFAIIWTTTPWTLPANMAIAFNPTYEYSAVEVGENVYFVASDLLNATSQSLGWEHPKVLVQVAGARLEYAVFRHPFLDRDSLGILADHVTLEQGTGAVHTAPGHGNEDYVVGQRYGISTYCPVDASGRFFDAEGASGELPIELIGKTIWEANPMVIEILKKSSALLAQQHVDHSYPHCWRCHNPTIFRATEQWFIWMEQNDLRKRTLAAIREVKWMPGWGQERISNMVASRPDWCISRQRVWGVPIVVFYCVKCSTTLTERRILDGVVKLFAEHTADVWYQRTAAELIPAGTACHHCGSMEFTKENDILDVWFDSGSSHLAVLTQENGLRWPADLYIEGGDQYRGWFHSSLLIGVALRGDPPYRECATNGWALDGDGRPLSKSIGNGVAPEEIIREYGAELIRLWSASVEFNEDVRISPVILTRLSEAYRKIRNTFRYALGNLNGFDYETDSLPGDELQEIDQWILLRAEAVVRECRAFYDEFAFHRVYRAVYDFATTDLSAVYFDILKDRLYTSAPRSQARRAAQTALYRMAYSLVRLLAPILTFTTEEVWPFLEQHGSVHTALFPAPDELSRGIPEAHRERSRNWDLLMPVREEVLKALESARQDKVIGAPLEARIRLSAEGDLYRLLDQYLQELPSVFIVSQVVLHQGGPGALTVEVERAPGAKCERCWKYTGDVGSSSDFPSVCAFCASVLREMNGEA